MTGVDVGAPVVEALARRFGSAVSGLKDSSGDWASTRWLCAAFGASMDVLVGSERFLAQALSAGAAGCVSASANVNPALLRELYDDRRPDVQRRAVELREHYETMPLIAALKHMTARRTGDLRWRNVTPPLSALALNGE